MSANGPYTSIQDWMLDLGLDVWETIAYAVIFGFSMDGESTFTGSLAYLSRKMMCSRAKTITSLRRLVDLGLVQKIEISRNNVKFCEYRVLLPDDGGLPGGRVVSPADGGSMPGIPGGGICGRPNNKEKENKEENNGYNIPREFDFRSALIGLGVAPETADAWLAVRRKARATNSKIAFDAVAREIGKTGMFAEDCIRIAVERSWRGFEADWILKKGRTQAPRYESPEVRTMRALRNLQERDGMLHTFNDSPDEQ